jgi:hypothetical protein
MTIHEPMTLATDYALAAVTAWLSVLLFKGAGTSQKLWALAFAALALGAFLGGTWHGLLQADLLWKATVLSVGVASFGMVAGSAFATLRGPRRVTLITLAAIVLVIYAGWMLFHDEFIFVVIDTAIGFAVVAALHVWRWNGWILLGIAASVAAALVQAARLAPHPGFNHNDLYHVMQIAAMVLLYRGARRLTDSGPPRPSWAAPVARPPSGR